MADLYLQALPTKADAETTDYVPICDYNLGDLHKVELRDLGIIDIVEVAVTTQATYGNFYVVDSASGAVDITLPSTAKGFARVGVLWVAGANAVRLLPYGTDLINGSNSPIALSAIGSIITVQFLDASNWYIVSRYEA